MILQIKLWLKRDGKTLILECSDPPGKVDGTRCDKLGREADYVLEIEADGPITPTRIRRVGLNRFNGVGTAKTVKTSKASKASKAVVAKKARAAKSDPPGKTGE